MHSKSMKHTRYVCICIYNFVAGQRIALDIEYIYICIYVLTSNAVYNVTKRNIQHSLFSINRRVRSCASTRPEAVGYILRTVIIPEYCPQFSPTYIYIYIYSNCIYIYFCIEKKFHQLIYKPIIYSSFYFINLFHIYNLLYIYFTAIIYTHIYLIIYPR